MITKLIIYFGLKDIKEFVRLLAKLEYGVSRALSNLAIDAEACNYSNLASMLKHHAAEEKNHGLMLATWCDKKERIRLYGGGRWLSLASFSGKELIKSKGLGNAVTLVVRGQEEYIGVFEKLDGISQRYLSLRMLLKGKKIIELPWSDRLACMAALEEGTNKLYAELCKKKDIPEEVRAIFTKIAFEESSHREYLEFVLRDFCPCPHQEIEKWQNRINLASLGLIYDFGKFLMEKRRAS